MAGKKPSPATKASNALNEIGLEATARILDPAARPIVGSAVFGYLFSFGAFDASPVFESIVRSVAGLAFLVCAAVFITEMLYPFVGRETDKK